MHFYKFKKTDAKSCTAKEYKYLSNLSSYNFLNNNTFAEGYHC